MVRIKELDGIRGIAILLVLLWHYVACQIGPRSSGVLSHFYQLLRLTWSGVDLFFVLSGFLIVGILLEAKGSKSYFKTFYIRRACRIEPLYLFMLCSFILIPLVAPTPNKWFFANSLPLLSYFTFSQNFFMHFNGLGPSWLSVTWSLAIEEQFYLLIPILVWRLRKKQLLFIFVCLICLAPIFRIIFGNLGALVFPFARSDSILMGGCLAILLRNPVVRAQLSVNYEYLVGVFFIFLIGAAVLSLKRSSPGDIFNHLWLGVLYSLFIVISILSPGKGIGIVLSNRFFVWLGLRSYGIYLLHIPVSCMTHYYINGSTSPRFSDPSDYYATLISLLIVFVLAEFSYRYFESIFLSFGKKYTY